MVGASGDSDRAADLVHGGAAGGGERKHSPCGGNHPEVDKESAKQRRACASAALGLGGD